MRQLVPKPRRKIKSFQTFWNQAKKKNENKNSKTIDLNGISKLKQNYSLYLSEMI